MKLKSIKLAGFKSFVDPTTVSLPGNLLAIVGPNGCGKSNIIDAVRWVLGESSAKTLRGESMADVIFNGSVDRKPLGQASVELLFDNSDGSLGGEYASYAEIAVRRLVTREGASHYFLNGSKCRRRDITDIFLGTGLGPRSYAIIEQGMISHLIESKPEQLRIFLEEAAGISKYKERRRETENRMRHTEENLARLTDVREELQRQLQHLQRQANTAKRYTEYKQQARLLQAQWQALQWRALDGERQQQTQAIREQEVKLEALVAQLRSVDATIEKKRAEHVDKNAVFTHLQEQFYRLGTQIARTEQQIEHQRDRQRQLQADLQQLASDQQTARQTLANDDQQQQQWRDQLAAVEPELTAAQQQAEQTAQRLSNAEQAVHEWQQRWDAFHQQASQSRQQAEVQQSRIQHLEQLLARSSARLQKLEQEQQALNDEPALADRTPLEQQLASIDEQLANKQREVERLTTQVDQQREQAREQHSQLDQRRRDLQHLRGQQASLETLQQAASGQQEKPLMDWLRKHDLDRYPRLAQSIKVASGWEKAVETVLGDYLQALCVDALDSVAQLVTQLEQGGLTFFAGYRDQPESVGRDNITTTLASKLEGEQPVAALLANIYVANDIASALALRPQLASYESVVTPCGLWFGPYWLRVAKDNDPQAGILQRQRQLDALSDDIEQNEQRVATLEAAALATAQALRDSETQREQGQHDLQQLHRQRNECHVKLNAHIARSEQINQRRQQLSSEITEQHEHDQHERQQLAQARLALQQALDAMERDKQHSDTLLVERDDHRQALATAKAAAQHDRDCAHQLALQVQSLQTQLATVQQNNARIKQQLEQWQQREQTFNDNLQAVDQPLREALAQLEQQLAERLQAEEKMTAAKAAVDALEHALRDNENKRREAQAQAGQQRDQLEQQRVHAQGLQVSCRTIEQQLEQSSFQLDTLLQELPTKNLGAEQRAWKEKLDAVEQRINRLGAINLAAIDEHKTALERKTHLDSQHDDITAALTTLQEAIRKIDKETRQRFKDTFDQVNATLQELFPKIFDGGKAYLALTGDDLLDTGVLIMAQPPGKRNSNIHLLSGGEKALTAIALTFAIFRLNPAPFCILDEVDAPLDDANVERYTRLVKSMAEQVQFIYITHNKVAMEMAEQLMGVTMYEPGVSRLVAVDIDKAAAMVA